MTDPRTPWPGDEMPEVPRKSPDEAPGILQQPERVRRWMRGLFIAAIVMLLADLVYEAHFHTELESGDGIYAFYGLYGFAGLIVLVGGAKLLRQFVMRKEDYYDE